MLLELYLNVTVAVPIVARAVWRRSGTLGLARLVMATASPRAARALAQRRGRLDSTSARATWRMLKGVVLLERALLRMGWTVEQSQGLLKQVVDSVGTAQMAHRVRLPSRSLWVGWTHENRIDFVRRALGQFPNLSIRRLSTTDGGIAFDVGGCHFVDQARRIGATHLMPLFCHVDEVFFQNSAESVLSRDRTLAAGDSQCEFRIDLVQIGAQGTPAESGAPPRPSRPKEAMA